MPRSEEFHEINEQWNSFLKVYVIGRTKIDLFGIAHVKVDLVPVLKIYNISILGRFAWKTNFVQCVHPWLGFKWYIYTCLWMVWDDPFLQFGA